MKLIKKPSSLLLLLFVLAIAFSSFKPVSAAAVTGFNAGNIIDDAIFTKKNSMSAAQIQTFLNSKVPTCDTNGAKTSEYGGGTRAQYGKSQGYPSPYVCLKSYKENPTVTGNSAINWWKNGRTNLQGRTVKASGAKSAAQIIYEASQEFSINPQVLIVLLQKEQGLVTDTWPWPIQYRSATGYGCPDTAACASQYYGFYNQVRWSARMFRAILNQSPTWDTPYGLGNNKIYWHPDTARCGSSTVNIQNLSTVALYSYTPYRPNQAALNAGYGKGNSCSAYGNRNFYQYFKDWFGSTHTSSTSAYQASFHSQSAYPTINAGDSSNAYFMFKNTGTTSWYDRTSAPTGTNPVSLATSGPINRTGRFTTGWSSANRPTTTFSAVYESDGITLASNQHVVLIGQIARFSFPYGVLLDYPSGTYTETFQPIVEGAQNWDMKGKVWHDVKINGAYKASYVSQSAYPTINRGGSSVAYIKMKNTGTATWYDSTSILSGQKPINLATSQPINRPSLLGSSWGVNKNRPAVNFFKVYESNGTTLSGNQHRAVPGQIVEYQFSFNVPQNMKTGKHREYLQPIVEGGIGWDMGLLAWIDVTVAP